MFRSVSPGFRSLFWDPNSSGSNANGRVDFVLQETLTESAVTLVSAMQAHFGYWENLDLALFMMRAAMNRDVMAEVGAEEHRGGGSKEAGG